MDQLIANTRHPDGVAAPPPWPGRLRRPGSPAHPRLGCPAHGGAA